MAKDAWEVVSVDPLKSDDPWAVVSVDEPPKSEASSFVGKVLDTAADLARPIAAAVNPSILRERDKPEAPKAAEPTPQQIEALATKQAAVREKLRKINPGATDEQINALSDLEMARKPKAFGLEDRIAELRSQGQSAEDAEQNAIFNQRLENRLNREFQKAKADPVTGERIQRSYQPELEAERVAAEAAELKRAQEADAENRGLAGLQQAANESPLTYSTLSGLASSANILNAPQAAINAVGEALFPDTFKPAPKWGFTDELNRTVQAATPEVQRKELSDSYRDGDLSMNLATNTLANAPSIIMSMVGGLLPAVRSAVLPAMGALSAGQNYAQGDSAGASVMKGAIEMATEFLPMKVFDTIKTKIGALPLPQQEQFVQVLGRKLAQTGTVLTVEAATNAIEETAAQVLGNAVDMGIQGKTDVGLMDGVDKAAAVGALTGGMMTAPHAAAIAARPGSQQEVVRSELTRQLNTDLVPDVDQVVEFDNRNYTTDGSIRPEATVLQTPESKLAALQAEREKLMAMRAAATPTPEVTAAAVTAPEVTNVDQAIAVAQAATTTTKPMDDALRAADSVEAAIRAAIPGIDQNALLSRVDEQLGLPTAPSAEAATTEQTDITGKPAASWVIRNRATGAVQFETWNPAVVSKINTVKYEAIPVGKHLAGVNAQIKSGQSAAPAPAIQSAATAPAGPRFYGVDSQPMDEGGQPFKSQAEAKKAQKLQPHMRVVKADGGFVLTEKTAKQLAAEAQAAKRLGSIGTGGKPLAAHEFLASIGGLSKSTMADLGFDKNVKLGAKHLFTNAGMSLERAVEALNQYGYLQSDVLNDAISLISRSAKGQPQYTPEGWDAIAEAEARARFEDHLQAQQEAMQDEDFDPFVSMESDGFMADDLVESGYDEASPDLQAEVSALLAQLEAMGVDTEMLREDAARATADKTEQEYYAELKKRAIRALAESAGGSRTGTDIRDAGAGFGQEAEPAGRGDRSEADGSEGAQGTDGEEDWLTALYGEGAETSAAPAQTAQKPADLSGLVDRLRAFSEQKLAEANDWASRQYKGNKTKITFEGDGPTRNESISVSRANEARRERNVQALQQQAQMASNLANRIERGRNVSAEIARAVADATDGRGPAIGKTLDDRIEGYISNALLGDENYAYGEGSVARLIREVYQSGDGITIKPGKGLIKGKFLAEVDGDGVPGGPFDTEGEARAAAVAYRAQTARNVAKSAEEQARRNRIAEKFLAGEGVTNAEIESLGLKTGTSDMRWFMSTAADLFGLKSRDIRPIVGDLIRVSLTDMGAKREFVPTRQALEAIARKVNFEAASEALTAPTRADVLAAQDRADNGQDLDEREQIRKESEAGAGSFSLTMEDGRVDDTGFLFSRKKRIDQTETEAFKRWFGDWQDPFAFSSKRDKNKTPVSQAVDSDGKPLVLYHATNGDFNEFQVARATTNSTTFGDMETERHGIFLTADVPFAEEYFRGRDGANVMPVYLNIKSPVDLTEGLTGEVITDIVQNSNLNRRDFYDIPVTDMWQLFDDNFGKQVVAALKEAGYDGAIMKELSRDRQREVEVWVAFDANQVKSATGNNGQFDPQNPDIRFSRKKASEPFADIASHFKRYPSRPPAGMSMDEAKAFFKARRDSMDALVEAYAPQAEGLLLPVANGGFWGVTREARPDGDEWRVTRFDRNMEPQGHEAHRSAKDAVADVLTWVDVSRLDEGMQFSRTAKAVKNLVTLHNLTEANLAYADSIGGMPVPSLGITKVDSPFSGFGDITLIGDKNMVDPQSGVPVFDRDAWTARFPTMNFKKVKSAKADAFYERFKPAKTMADDGDQFMSMLWDELANRKVQTPDGIADLFRRYNAAKAFYAKEVLGKDIKTPMRPYKPQMAVSADKAVIAFYKQNSRVMNGDRTEQQAAVMREFSQVLDAAVDRVAAEAGERAAVRAKMMREIIFNDSGVVNGSAFQAIERDIPKIGTKVLDGLKLREMVQKAVPDNDPAYLKWVQEQVAPLFDAPTITLRGREVAPTLDNLVEAMTVGATQGAEKSMTFGAGKLAAHLGKRFKSLAEIQDARDQVVSQQQEGEAKKATDQLLEEYRTHVTQFFTGKDYRGNIDTWAANDASMEALAKAGKVGMSDGAIRTSLQSKGFKRVDQKAIDMARTVITALRNAQTDYFEAKPQRAVGLDEFKGAVVPKGISPEALAILEKHGIQVEFYGKGEGAREKAIAKMAKRLDKVSGDVLYSQTGQKTAPAFTPAQLRAAAAKTHGNLLAQGEKKGVVMLAGMDDLIDQAAKDRAAATGGDWQEIKKSILRSVQNSMSAPSTDNFKRWFKDSKVVGADGKPLVVYHGTAADVTFFDSLALGINTNAMSARRGFFFAASPKVASGYAMLSESRPALRNKILKNAAASDVLPEDIKQFLLDASEQFTVEDLKEGEWIQDAGGGVSGANVLPVYLSIQNPMVVDYGGNEYREFKFADVIAEAKAAGHDGVIFRNAEDSAHKGYSEVTDIFVVFEPTQVKSATGNNGNYDPTDLDIRRSANGDINGFHDPKTGKSYLNADTLTPDTIGPVMVHEFWHGANRDGALDAVNERALAMVKAGKGNAFFDSVAKAMDDAGETSAEEAAAYLVQQWEQDTINAPKPVKRWIQNLVAAVRAWLFNKGIILKADQLTEADIAAVARMLAKEQVAGQNDSGAVQFSKSIGEKLGNFYDGLRARLADGRAVGDDVLLQWLGGEDKTADPRRGFILNAGRDPSLATAVWEGNVLGTGEYATSGLTFTQKGKRTFLMPIFPGGVLTDGSEADVVRSYKAGKFVWYFAAEQINDNEWSVGMDGAYPGTAFYDRLMASGELSPARNGYHRFKIPEGTTEMDLLREGARRLVLLLGGQTPKIQFNRETGANPSKDKKFYTPERIEARFSKSKFENSAAFRRWFGDSKVVDAEGKPLVVYHGTNKDLSSFDRGGPIFVTPKPQFASKFAAGNQFASGRTKKFRDGANIMPVYVKSENPFDFEDANQLRAVQAEVQRLADKYGMGRMPIVAENIEGVAEGRWTSIEYALTDEAIKNLGHDGFYVMEQGVKNLAVFRPEQIKSATGNNGNYDPTNPDIRFSRGRRQGNLFASRFNIPDETRMQRAQRKIQDHFNRVKVVQDLLRQQGGNIDEASDVYRAEERMHGIVQEKMVDLRDQVLEPLVKLTATSKIELDELALYAYAKHAQERNAYIQGLRTDMPDSGSGMTDAEAQDILDAVAQSGQQAEYDAAHRMLLDINRMRQDLQLQSGLITQAEYDAWRNQYQNYVPLRGFEAVDDEGKVSERGKGTGRKFNIRGKETLRALGRQTRAADIIENVISDYQTAVVRAEKNSVLQRFLKLVMDNPDPDLWEIDAVKTRAAMNRTTGQVSTQFVIDKGPDTVGLKVAGREVYLKIHDEVLARALRGPEDNSAAQTARMISNLTGHYLNLLRNTITRFNPEFALTNMERDLGMALPAVIDDLGEKGGALFAKHYPGATAASAAALVGKLNKMSPEWQRYFTEYRESGGTTGGFYVMDADDLRTDLRMMMVAAGAQPKTAYERVVKATQKIGLRHAGKALEFLGATSEHAARVAAFRAAREMGKSAAEAAAIAKNLTTNFNRKGEWGGLVNALYLFANANIQGNARLFKMLKNPRMRKYFAGMAGAMAALAMWNAGAGGDDDDGEPYWDKIPQFIKERNLIIMLPPGFDMDGAEKVGQKGRYITIAAPFGLNTFSNLGYELADVYRNAINPMHGHTPARAAWNMTSGVVAALNPFGGSLQSQEAALLMVLPTVFDLPTQFLLGVDAFGKPVAPHVYDEDSTVKSENVNIRQAGGPAHMLARWINKISGGDTETKGLVDLSPGALENAARNVTGGAGKFVYDSIALAGKAFDDQPDIFVREVPFVRRAYGEVDGDVDQGLFYERRQQIKEAKAQVRRHEKAGVQTTDPEVVALASLSKQAEKTSGDLASIRRSLIDLRKDTKQSATYKRATERELKKQRDELTTEFNRQWRDTMDVYFKSQQE